jgi:regulatory protein
MDTRTKRRSRPPRQAPSPDAGQLHAAALTYLARYAATQAGLTRVLNRKIDRWARESQDDPDVIAAVAAQARADVAGIVAKLASAGAISDEAFAASRARSLARAGRSRRAIGAHLSNKGVPQDLAGNANTLNVEQELAAALIHARKRRLGPWRRGDATPKEMASLARAGFSRGIAAKALKLDQNEAEELIIQFRAEL